MLGEYEFDVTYYSEYYEVVEKPSESGRYGAVVKIEAEDGMAFPSQTDPVFMRESHPGAARKDSLKMKKTRHTTDQIIEKLRQANIALGKITWAWMLQSWATTVPVQRLLFRPTTCCGKHTLANLQPVAQRQTLSQNLPPCCWPSWH